MINREISNKILTVGCEYRHPKGGVAQVMYNYEQYVFLVFKCVVNSGGTNKLQKLFKAVTGWCNMAYKLCTDKRIKIVHIHTASYNSFKRSAYFVQLAQWYGKKVVLHIHGGGFKEYYATNPQWIASILNRCDAIITLSESWKEFYQSVTEGVDIYIVENIVALPVEKVVKKQDNKFHLLFLGLVDKQKGIFDLLDVLYEHINEFQGKVMLHIGGNGQIEELKNQIEQYKIDELVAYEGFVSGEKKTDLLLGCDAFILPSYVEGLPVSILEAMSYGKPILATPVGGIPEIVKQYENGILFQPGDREEIYKTLKTLVTDSKLRENMGRESKRKAESYLPQNVTSSLMEVYKNL